MKRTALFDKLLIVTYAVVLVFLLFNIKTVLVLFGRALRVLSPFIYGFVIAYILKGPLNFFRDRVYVPLLSKRKNGSVKGAVPLALVTTYICVLLIISALFSIILPQLITSISTLVDMMPYYLQVFDGWASEISVELGLGAEFWASISQYWQELLEAFTNMMSNMLPRMVDAAKGITAGIANLTMGFVVSVYLLLGKDRICVQCKKLAFAWLPRRWARNLVHLAQMTNRTFGGFISGQLTDAFIVGVLCFIGMSIFRMPYALLSATIVGFTNVIPYFGPIIGSIPCTFIILMNNPIKAVWFVIMIVVIQQIDGNLIVPRVVGNSVGLSGIWVMFAILVGGHLMGVVGMVIGLPTFAVIYSLIQAATSDMLSLKGLDPDDPEQPPAPPAPSSQS